MTNKHNLSEEELLSQIKAKDNIPSHIAIIMDGNGRWAKERSQPRIFGHRAGMQSVRNVVEAAREVGIEVLTLYAFSTENWKRPKQEIDFLMRLLVEYLRKEVRELDANNVRLTTIGNTEILAKLQKEELKKAIDLTASNDGLILNLALNYGSRIEIIQAIRNMYRDCKSKNFTEEQITSELFSSYLYTSDLPDPDLLIRTSGEMRLSNFLLWQLAYTELWITEVYWPDFTKKHFYNAIFNYQSRERRFGNIQI